MILDPSTIFKGCLLDIQIIVCFELFLFITDLYGLRRKTATWKNCLKKRARMVLSAGI